MTNPSDYTNLPPRLTTDEVAKILRVCKRTLWKRHREGRGPQPVTTGRPLLYDRDEVLAAAGIGGAR